MKYTPTGRRRESRKQAVVSDPKDLDPALQHREHGKEALARGDLSQALVEFEEASKGEPTDGRNWLRVAEIQSRLGNGAAAIEAYRHAARMHTEQGFYRHAVAIYKNLLALAPNDIDANKSLAALLGRLGLLSDATLQYEYLIKACHLAERGADALDALRRIVDLNPDDVRIRLRYVDMAFANGRSTEALACLRDVAGQLKGAGRIDEYLRVAERLLAEEPHNMALARDIAKGYIVRGNGRYALARLKMCFDKEPKDAETLDLLAQAFELCGQNDKAATLLVALGRIHRDQGRNTLSQDAFHRALDLNPVDGEAQRLLDEVSGKQRRISSIDIPIVPEEPGQSGTFNAVDTEETTLKNHMPAFVSSDELRVVDLAPAGNAVFDLFPVRDAQKLVTECQVLLEKTTEGLRRLINMLPAQMTSREMIERSIDRLTPGGELVTELAMLADALARNKWVSDIGAPAPRRKS